MGRPASEPIAFSLGGPMARADLPSLCERVGALLEQTGARVACCNVDAAQPDAVTVDALARLQLAARRHGCRLRLEGASAELLQLVDFMGLRACIS
jgi:ABC-type transporter Mla MlaB component